MSWSSGSCGGRGSPSSSATLSRRCDPLPPTGACTTSIDVVTACMSPSAAPAGRVLLYALARPPSRMAREPRLSLRDDRRRMPNSLGLRTRNVAQMGRWSLGWRSSGMGPTTTGCGITRTTSSCLGLYISASMRTVRSVVMEVSPVGTSLQPISIWYVRLLANLAYVCFSRLPAKSSASAPAVAQRCSKLVAFMSPASTMGVSLISPGWSCSKRVSRTSSCRTWFARSLSCTSDSGFRARCVLTTRMCPLYQSAQCSAPFSFRSASRAHRSRWGSRFPQLSLNESTKSM
mmetsp:Transcript_19016/g.47860  ORF Transcript_19016/g.47860 Transcript_19016/m.47860 type:complete len:289 (-) Transcript_19016:880-1746(-)